MTRQELAEKIMRRLGAPMVKVELDSHQIFDNIDYARQRFIKWAIGQATTDRYYTMLLYAGVSLYDLRGDILDVIDYEIGGMGSIHQLFSITNYLYNNGLFDQMLMRGLSDGYSLISYHIARDFLETTQRYIVAPYDFIWHRYSNQLEITPTPVSGTSLTFMTSAGEAHVDSPGFVLLRVVQAEGTPENLYDTQWVHDYALALCKISLGRVRSKFANYTSIGSNVGIPLDGDSLIAEGQSDIERLDIALRTEEVYEGMEISFG